ncbi:endothelial lipase [Salvelinus sp. IW2-2015]|uniref:endothelial lipase n=1 Tax=Salvelinus sp. IW2-2015 TaxID=2691554 RepID=UPI0038D3A0FF
MSGMFESWMRTLVAAVMQREPEANVVIVEWLPMAHQLYPDAVNHTHQVGLSVATTINWLQEEQQMPLQNVHLIGYSLGAHVAGYAGTFVRGSVGRITGLDPAGPMFEGVGDEKRLSSDDADFVDVLHTYTREALGVSIGIQQPIGDIDIYPNGGDVQPGCDLTSVLTSAAGGNFMDVMKCEHERAVHLFVDSLISKEHTSFAYQCTDPERFKKGICLSCRKNRCNNMGYNAKKTRKRRNSKMYLKTRADTPFGGELCFVALWLVLVVPTVTETSPRREDLTQSPRRRIKTQTAAGDYGRVEDLTNRQEDNQSPQSDLTQSPRQEDFNPEPASGGFNAEPRQEDLTQSPRHHNHLLKIRLSWEGASESFGSFWKNIKKSFWDWKSSSNKPTTQVLEVRRIRVKCGETQKKFTFCAQDTSLTEITPGQGITYVKCRDGWEVKPSKKRLHI